MQACTVIIVQCHVLRTFNSSRSVEELVVTPTYSSIHAPVTYSHEQIHDMITTIIHMECRYYIQIFVSIISAWITLSIGTHKERRTNLTAEVLSIHSF